MANIDAPFGLRPVGRDGSSYDGRLVLGYWAGHASNVLHIGDPVKRSGTADASGEVAAYTRSAATEAIRGVIVGFERDANSEGPTRDTPKFLSTAAGYFLMAPANDEALFEIQEDGAMAITAVGSLVDVVYGTDRTEHPFGSVAELDSSTSGSGAQLEVVGLARKTGNALGTNAVWRVKVAQSALDDAGV